jgi:hypothetical protein
MSPITFEDQFETLNPSAPGCQYRQRFNLLDLLLHRFLACGDLLIRLWLLEPEVLGPSENDWAAG